MAARKLSALTAKTTSFLGTETFCIYDPAGSTSALKNKQVSLDTLRDQWKKISYPSKGSVTCNSDGSITLAPAASSQTVSLGGVVTIENGTENYIDHLFVIKGWNQTNAKDAGIRLLPLTGTGGSPFVDMDNDDGRSRIGRNAPQDNNPALFVGTGGNTRSALQIGNRDARPVQLFTDDACRLIVKETTGYVGIGTQSPDCALSVVGGFRTTDICVFGGNITANGVGTQTFAGPLSAAGDSALGVCQIGNWTGVSTTYLRIGNTALNQGINANYAITQGPTGDTAINSAAGTFLKGDNNLRIQLDSTGIGFNGVSPIARVLLATGAGKTVDDVITVLQNYGLCRQS